MGSYKKNYNFDHEHEKGVKPFLRWAGSKVQLLPEIKKYWNPQYQRYVEPFCGSACLFFSIRPPSALLSDLNGELICTLAQVQVAADVIVECLGRMKIDNESYYKIRAINPSQLSPNERAARFIYLNALCFNGLYRTNRAGQFNVPYGGAARKTPFDSAMLIEASRSLKSAVIECSDFERVVDQTSSGDFLYLDPPYATSSERIFSEYGKDLFVVKDLERLIDSVMCAEKRGVKFVLSYADVPEVQKLTLTWSSFRVSARRNIAGFAGARKRASEILITNCE
jgi:DNA adenine methylase